MIYSVALKSARALSYDVGGAVRGRIIHIVEDHMAILTRTKFMYRTQSAGTLNHDKYLSCPCQ